MSLEERVAAIEERLGMEAGLRAAGDRDLADMAATLRSLRALIQAVAITQSEHTQILDRHAERLTRIESGVSQILTLLNRLTDEGNES